MNRAFFLVPLAALLASAAGCATVRGGDEGTELNYLHTPEALFGSDASTTPVSAGSLFPSSPGMRWSMQVSTRRRTEKGYDEDGGQQLREDVIVQKEKARVGDVSGTLLQMLQNGKPYRQEVYQIDARGITLVAAGGADKMVMQPPMPIVTLPLKAREIVQWQGSLRFQGTVAPGEAYSRFAGKEKVTTPAGTFDAYRIETMLRTQIQGRPVSFPSTRWFAPGVGIVRQKFVVFGMNNTVVEIDKEMTSYKNRRQKSKKNTDIPEKG